MDIWSNKWWLKPQWMDQIGLPKNEVERRVKILEEIFDQDWVNSLGDDPNWHPLVRDLNFGEGLHQIRHLLSLSHEIETLRDIIGFKKVLRNYKLIEQASAAQHEMFMATSLVDSGYEVEFIIPKAKKGKTPDILASKDGKSFAVECKYLSIGIAERWIRSYGLHFAVLVTRSVPDEIEVIFTPCNPYVDVRSYGYPNNLIPAILAAELDVFPVLQAINGMLYADKFPVYRRIQGKGECVLALANSGIKTRVTIPELDVKFLIRRLLGNGIETASKQIQEYGIPGVAAIFQAEPADFLIIKEAFHDTVAKFPERYDCLMGMLVFPAQNILQYIRPYWIANTFSRYKLEDFSLPAVFDELFLPIRELNQIV